MNTPPKTFRDAHHMMAQMLAIGMTQTETARRLGYSRERVSQIAKSPAFQELIAQYREERDEIWRESIRASAYSVMREDILTKSTRQMLDHLEEAEAMGEKLPPKTLLAFHDSMADRTGHGKSTTSINVNLDFAARLERAMERSGVVLEQVGARVALAPRESRAPHAHRDTLPEPRAKIIDAKAVDWSAAEVEPPKLRRI